MNKLILLSMIAVLPFYFSEAHAAPAVRTANAADVAAFREPAKKLFQRAIQQGLLEVNGINLRQVLEKMDSVEVVVAKTQFANRSSAIWQPMKITYNPLIFATFSDPVKEILAAHEYLGATSVSWRDDGYSHSFYIWMYAYKAIFQATLNQFQWPSATGTAPMELAGGSTVVGGGGDGRDIYVKMNALLCLNSTIQGGSCLAQKLKESKQPIPALIRGLLFVNWYVTPEVQEGVYQFYIPKDKSIQATILIHPNTYNQTLNDTSALGEAKGVFAIIDMAILFVTH